MTLAIDITELLFQFYGQKYRIHFCRMATPYVVDHKNKVVRMDLLQEHDYCQTLLKCLVHVYVPEGTDEEVGYIADMIWKHSLMDKRALIVNLLAKGLTLEA